MTKVDDTKRGAGAPSLLSKAILAGKRGLVMGVANNRSIAWGIAKAAHAAGAKLAFTFQGDALKNGFGPWQLSLMRKLWAIAT